MTELRPLTMCIFKEPSGSLPPLLRRNEDTQKQACSLGKVQKVVFKGRIISYYSARFVWRPIRFPQAQSL